jgi:RNA polymerase sigma-70 factor (ECF subfamily)
MKSSRSPCFEERVVAFAPVLRAFLRRRTKDADVANDIAQDVLLKAFGNRRAIRDTARVEAWLYRTARRALIDHHRQARRLKTVAAADIAAEVDRRKAMIESIARAARAYLDALPPTYRDAVRLAEEEELPAAEVARRLGISLTAAKSRVRRGKMLVRRLLEGCCAFEYDCAGRIVECDMRRGASCP